jgi:hypothetical protein
MKEQHGKTATVETVKEQLQALTGNEIDIKPSQLINLQFPFSIYDSTNDGTMLVRRIVFPFTKTCFGGIQLLDVAGVGATGDSGSETFLVSGFLCSPQQLPFLEPINILATARSASPVFLTTTHTVIRTGPSAPDLQITVFAWDSKGQPAAGVDFDWRCRAAVEIVIP